MEQADIAAKWDVIEKALDYIFIAEASLRKRKFLQPFDDGFKQDLLCELENIFNTTYTTCQNKCTEIWSIEQTITSASSVSNVDSGCPLTTYSSCSRSSIDSSIPKSSISSQIGSELSVSSTVNDSPPHSEQENASDTNIAIASALNSSESLSGGISFNLDGDEALVSVDPTEATPTNKTEESKDQNTKEASSQLAKQQTKKRKRECDTEKAKKKTNPKKVDTSNDDNTVQIRYKCEQCDMSFSRKPSLAAHIEKVHLKCNICGNGNCNCKN